LACPVVDFRAPGVLFADDMGLGKEFQALSFLAWLKSNQTAAGRRGDCSRGQS
jgi:hypothetical protein